MVLLLVARATMVQVRAVGSDSMSPTLTAGERLAVATVGFDRWSVPVGTIVVFDAADLWTGADDPAGTVFVKRVIGVGGDHLRCCDAEGRLVRNGVPAVEEYLADPGGGSQGFDVVVQPGHYWLMGDNRPASSDSRAHLGDPGGGNVPASRIIGTVEAVVWPPGSVRRVEGPDDAAG